MTHEYVEAFDSYFPPAGIEYYYYDQLAPTTAISPTRRNGGSCRVSSTRSSGSQALGLRADNFILSGSRGEASSRSSTRWNTGRISKGDGTTTADGLTYGGFASIFRRLKRKVPREMDFKLHRAHNTAITNWLRNGNDLHTTMKLAGHKWPKVTERYAGEFTDDELRKLVRPSFTAIYGRRSA